MPAIGSRLSLFALLVCTTAVFAQSEPLPVPMPIPPELPQVPMGETPNVPLAGPATEILTEPGLPPLPGSLADEFGREYANREKFRTTTWRGSIITGFPNSLLWEPALAVRRDPRLQFLYSNQSNYKGSNTVDTSIGGTAGLVRADLNGADLAYQLDMFGVVQTRLSPDDLIAADYRFGIPLTWRRGWWQGKIAYEHTSSHIGDEAIINGGFPVRTYAKDEVVLGLGRIFDCRLRVYGHLAYAFSNQIPDFDAPPGVIRDRDSNSQERVRADLGFEWFDRNSTGFGGTPFLAANVEIRGDQNWGPNFRAQAGWLWRNPTQRMGNGRVFVEYYTGHTPYGQFYANTETQLALGFGFDY